jgi:hypothetical protein
MMSNIPASDPVSMNRRAPDTESVWSDSDNYSTTETIHAQVQDDIKISKRRGSPSLVSSTSLIGGVNSNLDHCSCALHTLWRRHISSRISRASSTSNPTSTKTATNASTSMPPPHCPSSSQTTGKQPLYGAVIDCPCALHTLWRTVKGMPEPRMTGRLGGGSGRNTDSSR